MRASFVSQRRPSSQLKRRDIKDKLVQPLFNAAFVGENSEPIFNFNSTFLRLNEALPTRPMTSVKKKPVGERTITPAHKQPEKKSTKTLPQNAERIKEKIQERIRRIISKGAFRNNNQQSYGQKKPLVAHIDYLRKGYLSSNKKSSVCQAKSPSGRMMAQCYEPAAVEYQNTEELFVSRKHLDSLDEPKETSDYHSLTFCERPRSTMKFTGQNCEYSRKGQSISRATYISECDSYKPVSRFSLTTADFRGKRIKMTTPPGGVSKEDQILPWELDDDNSYLF